MSYPPERHTGRPPAQPYSRRPQPYRPPYPPPYQAYAMQQHGVIVSNSHLSAAAHIVHGFFTFVTCGAWGVVWFIHAMLARRRTVTRY